ncbi:tRNA (N6-isopentenyl adenosine(37)-C2)-methylthiotransferase MiaB [Nitratidesulfovibrio liaohensis]|uniref:tRNA-2-methylthio-N(6)-dimethylallyladenosine synthase n=1 Tax=Nitratidesulfovibrio liaohensis TaxID=2604158 RepID=A0ABY9R8G8_9BACT|nr:tRNA (N6-isopentenyl adenosine(37)-C2)-methylthiotransferase MiaB [Nitratidesulfovibrio liaohensis]WMW66974.1 tRNA (N6-isopentenyl adenosine(37)-C2)-methylthiotransferase MiaB [Nitratidesulfovibrio liaohensis]
MSDRTFHILTFGCQMNVNDSDWLARALVARGFTEAPLGKARVNIVNTCSVRDKPEQKVYSVLGRIRQATRKLPDAFAVVGGCVAQQIGSGFFTRFPQVRLVFGGDGSSMAPQAIERLCAEPGLRVSLLDFSEEYPERDAQLDSGPVPPSAFVNIMQGCDNFCAYCIVPYTRGRQKSRAADAVVRECAELVQRGAGEITLLGQNVNSYGQDAEAARHATMATAAGDGNAVTFAELLHRVAALPGLDRLRFVTPHPKDIAPEVIDAFGTLDNLCPRLHLPLQSGSDRILKAMGRKYDMARYMDIVHRLKAARPDIQLSTDIIVGFPGETEQDFEDTLAAMRAVGFAASFSFCYSDRPGTRAEMLPGKLDAAEKAARLARLQEWQNDYTEQCLRNMVGLHTMVLLDGMSRKPGMAAPAGHEAGPDGVHDGVAGTPGGESWQGRDPYGQAVNVVMPPRTEGGAEGWLGQIVPVTIVEAKKHSLRGVLRA